MEIGACIEVVEVLSTEVNREKERKGNENNSLTGENIVLGLLKGPIPEFLASQT